MSFVLNLSRLATRIPTFYIRYKISFYVWQIGPYWNIEKFQNSNSRILDYIFVPCFCNHALFLLKKKLIKIFLLLLITNSL